MPIQLQGQLSGGVPTTPPHECGFDAQCTKEYKCEGFNLSHDCLKAAEVLRLPDVEEEEEISECEERLDVEEKISECEELPDAGCRGRED